MDTPRLLLTATACLALAAPAFAQDPGHDPTFTAQKVYLRGTEIRAPAEMNNNEIRLIGMEEGGVAFRANTPALEGAFKPRQVDEDAAYRRRTAMYEQPAGPDAAIAAAVDPVEAPAPAAAQPEVASPEAPGSSRSGVGWVLLLAGIATLGAVLLALRSMHRAETR